MRRASPATIIASIALFFSLAGTGIAASSYVITSTKQIKPSVLKSLRGAQGPRGLQGPAGAAGAAGPAGPAGAAGAAGAAGNLTAANVITVLGSPATPPATMGGSAGSVANCPAGDVVLGGGFIWNFGTVPDTSVITNNAQGSTSWAVSIQNNTTATAPSFAAEAICGP